MNILKEHKFYTKLTKCDLCKKSIEYLGFIVDSEGVHVD